MVRVAGRTAEMKHNQMVFSTRWRVWALLIIVFNVGVSACSTRKVCRAHPVFSKDAAILAAKHEAIKRGWVDVTVEGAITPLSSGGWQMLLVRKPFVFGGHALVEVSVDGKIQKWSPGY